MKLNILFTMTYNKNLLACVFACNTCLGLNLANH